MALADLDRVVSRAERGIRAARRRPEDQDLYIDSAALNLHDFYAGLERIFQQIGSTVDGNMPTGHNWHRELL
jgi:HepT-like protein